ncbi:hypothetical protein INR49_001190 [Caranx melampygus]|nr:hypothetical protein INR49_001190 [Caranx melampygus]
MKEEFLTTLLSMKTVNTCTMSHQMVGLSIQSPLSTISVLVLHLLLVSFAGGQSQLTGSSQPIVASISDDIILPCHLEPAEDVSAYTLEWTRSNLQPSFVYVWRSRQELVDDKHPLFSGRTSLFTDELKRGNISLKLSRVKPADEGRYRCFILDKDAESFVELLVGAASSPVISLAGADRDKGSVVLQCESKGWYPEPELLWLDAEGELLSAGPTQTVRGPDDLYTVSSRVTVEKRHSNSFTCRVQQKTIHQSRDTQIHVAETKRRQRDEEEREREKLLTEEKMELEKQLEQKQGELKELQEEKKKQEDELKELQEEKKKQEDELQSLMKDLKTKDKQLKQKQDELQWVQEEKKKQIDELQSQKKDLETKDKQIQDDRWWVQREKKKQKDELQSQIKQLETKITQLEQKQDDDLQQLQEEKKKQEDELQSLMKDLETKDKQIKQKQAELKTLSEDNQRMEDKLKELKEKLNIKNSEVLLLSNRTLDLEFTKKKETITFKESLLYRGHGDMYSSITLKTFADGRAEESEVKTLKCMKDDFD